MRETTEFRAVAGTIHDATSYRDVFLYADEAAINKTFRSLARIVHPDVVDSQDGDEALVVTSKLTALHDAAQTALREGTFGADSLLVFESAVMRHEVHAQLMHYFDMTTGYAARSIRTSGAVQTIVKVAQTPRDNELLAAESDALNQLATLPLDQRAFFPKLLDSFAIASGRKRLRANAVVRLDGFVNLDEVHERYPAGIHPLDAAWMWRRVLWALGGAHEKGVLHGALVPSHIMIHPTLHGVVLVDWCYSLQRVDQAYPALRAIVGAKRDWYPGDVLNRTPPTAMLDIALAAHSIHSIIDRRALPDAMARYFTRLASVSGSMSAYEALAQFDTLLERLGAPYHPRTYRPLNW